MNFFQAQDQARKNTTRLVVFFTLAVISLIVLTNILVMFSFGYLNQSAMNNEAVSMDLLRSGFDWQVFWATSAGVVLLITLGSLYKMSTLSRGGASVAEMLGAKLLVDGNNDINVKKVLNVVEEMAIASGTPVPPVYLLENEAGINAFAAGFKTGDAVIGVTRGCIDKLNREQLQGVIAHEFSHILNGDMRLNIRLIGILHGILLLGLIGYYILRGSSRGVRRRSSRNNGAGGILVLGMGLIVIGYAGTFFGNLIKAAVSRQREYLADSSAVQFTRNPDGIAGALKRIGGSSAGSIVENPSGAQISHAFFSQSMTTMFSSLFATHPPLEKRIRRIDPQWDGVFDSGSDSDSVKMAEKGSETKSRSDQDRKTAFTQTVITGAILSDATFEIDQVGNPSADHLAYAHQLVENLPEPIRLATHEPHGARAVIYLLLLDKNKLVRSTQLQMLEQESDDGVYEALMQLDAHYEDILPEHRLTLMDMASPSLRQLTNSQYDRFRGNVIRLIKADARISLFEWSLIQILFTHLDVIFGTTRPVRHKYNTYNKLAEQCSILLSTIINNRKPHTTDQQTIQQAGEMLNGIQLSLLPTRELSIEKLNRAINDLNQLKPLLKPQLLKAIALCITSDQKISIQEHELFRAIADSLDCPMPPLLVTE